MSLARRHQDRILAAKAASAPASGGGLTHPVAIGTTPFATARTTPANHAAATIKLRMTHDLRRLKEIKSVAHKIAAKREMLPEYRAWVRGILDAAATATGRELAPTGADEVLPTVMVWCIDIGDYEGALALAAVVIRFNVAMPSRYERDAATLVLEEIAEAALRAQNSNESFPLDVLEQVEALTDGIDMHDQPRAKLLKAIGRELTDRAGGATPDAARPMIEGALARYTAAQGLDPRIGVKTAIRGLEKARAALPSPATPDAPTESQLMTSVGGSEARPAMSVVNADGAEPPCAAKAGNDATNQEP
jgi:hypothetical protein